MKIIKGDLLKLAEEGRFDVIVHGCNCFNTMGAGIAKQIKQQFHQAYAIDCTTKKGDRNKLGTISIAVVPNNVGTNFVIVNAYTQYRYDVPFEKEPFRYEAIRSAFREVKNLLPGHKIGYPKIGAGLAGGDWDIISKIIDEELEGEHHTLVEWSIGS